MSNLTQEQKDFCHRNNLHYYTNDEEFAEYVEGAMTVAAKRDAKEREFMNALQEASDEHIQRMQKLRNEQMERNSGSGMGLVMFIVVAALLGVLGTLIT